MEQERARGKIFFAVAVKEIIYADALTWSIDGTVTGSLKTPGAIAFKTGELPSLLR